MEGHAAMAGGVRAAHGVPPKRPPYLMLIERGDLTLVFEFRVHKSSRFTVVVNETTAQAGGRGGA